MGRSGHAPAAHRAGVPGFSADRSRTRPDLRGGAVALGGRTALVITDNAVHKHIGNVFAKLGLAVTDSGHRRVLAVLTYLNGAGQLSGG